MTTLWAAWRGKAAHAPVDGSRSVGAETARRAFRQGLLSNLGNPKMVLFFSSLLPQFAPAGGPTFLGMLALGLLFCAMTVTWLSGYAWLVARAGVVLRAPRVRRAVDTISGIVLVAMGIRVAAEPVVVER